MWRELTLRVKNRQNGSYCSRFLLRCLIGYVIGMAQTAAVLIDRMVTAGLVDLAEELAIASEEYVPFLRSYYRHCISAADAIAAPYLVIAKEEVENLEPGFFKRLASKLKSGVKRILSLFKIPKIVAALKDLLGEISVANVLALIKKGKDYAKKIGKSLKDKAWFAIDQGKIPTVTDLVLKTEIGLKAQGLYQQKVKPWVQIVDDWLKKYLPVLSKIALAALFAYIWFNVEELSWEPSDLIRGFTGALSLTEMVATLPESAFGLLISFLMGGLGYTIMPYLLIPRLAWMLAKGYIKWHKGRFKSEVVPAEA